MLLVISNRISSNHYEVKRRTKGISHNPSTVNNCVIGLFAWRMCWKNVTNLYRLTYNDYILLQHKKDMQQIKTACSHLQWESVPRANGKGGSCGRFLVIMYIMVLSKSPNPLLVESKNVMITNTVAHLHKSEV